YSDGDAPRKLHNSARPSRRRLHARVATFLEEMITLQTRHVASPPMSRCIETATAVRRPFTALILGRPYHIAAMTLCAQVARPLPQQTRPQDARLASPGMPTASFAMGQPFL